MNILITGVNGFIGRALAQGLARDGHAVYGLDISDKDGKTRPAGLTKFFPQDISESFTIEQSFDCVFHLAALNVTHVNKATSDEYYQINVLGTENLLKAATTKKFVLMSTIKVYGKQEAVVNEGSPLEQKDNYEKSKLDAEELCRRFLKKDQLVILRPVNIVGPGQGKKAILPVFFDQAMAGENICVFVPRRTPVHLLYVDDIIDAFRKILERREVSGIFNLVSRDTISVEDLALEVVRVAKSTSTIDFTNDADALDFRYSSCCAKNILGWEPRFSCRDIIEKYHSFLKES